MKRDPRLHGLSSDHHHALRLALRATRIGDGADAADPDVAWGEVRSRFQSELAPHFEIEERLLLPPLQDAGEGTLVERTLGGHAAIRECVAAPASDHRERLGRFGALLTAHVRFEEQVLFPAAERTLSVQALDRIAAATRARLPAGRSQ